MVDIFVVLSSCILGLLFPIICILVLCVQGQLKDDNYIFTSKPYTILSDQLHHLNAEIERYKGLVEVLQVICFSSVVLLFCKVFSLDQLFLSLTLE